MLLKAMIEHMKETLNIVKSNNYALWDKAGSFGSVTRTAVASYQQLMEVMEDMIKLMETYQKIKDENHLDMVWVNNSGNPACDGKFIALTKLSDCFSHMEFKDGVWKDRNGITYSSNDITAWMPMPEPYRTFSRIRAEDVMSLARSTFDLAFTGDESAKKMNQSLSLVLKSMDETIDIICHLEMITTVTRKWNLAEMLKPAMDRVCIVTVRGADEAIPAYYVNGNWMDFDSNEIDVVAWMNVADNAGNNPTVQYPCIDKKESLKKIKDICLAAGIGIEDLKTLFDS